MIDYFCVTGGAVIVTFFYFAYRESIAEIKAKHEERKKYIEAREELASKIVDKSPAEIKRCLDIMLPRELLDEEAKESYKIGRYTVYNTKQRQAQLIDDGINIYYWPVLTNAAVRLGSAKEIKETAEESEDPTAYLENKIAKAEATLREQRIKQKRKRIV